MANSLRDQLLKAGLVTEAQLEKAQQPPPKPKAAAARPQQPRPEQRPAARSPTPQRQPERKVARPQSESSDLAQFYAARAAAERAERLEAEQRQRELAARRKQTREQVAQLVNAHLQNVDDAEIRYNFVVGNNIKYLYVTEQQQHDLADGKLAITFQAGKRCLIPVAIAEQIRALDPEKIVIINTPEDTPTAQP